MPLLWRKEHICSRSKQKDKNTVQQSDELNPLNDLTKRLAASNAKKKVEQEDPDTIPPKYWDKLWIPFVILMVGFLCLAGLFFNNGFPGGASFLVIAYICFYLMSTCTYGSFSKKKILRVLLIAGIIAVSICWIHT